MQEIITNHIIDFPRREGVHEAEHMYCEDHKLQCLMITDGKKRIEDHESRIRTLETIAIQGNARVEQIDEKMDGVLSAVIDLRQQGNKSSGVLQVLKFLAWFSPIFISVLMPIFLFVLSKAWGK